MNHNNGTLDCALPRQFQTGTSARRRRANRLWIPNLHKYDGRLPTDRAVAPPLQPVQLAARPTHAPVAARRCRVRHWGFDTDDALRRGWGWWSTAAAHSPARGLLSAAAPTSASRRPSPPAPAPAPAPAVRRCIHLRITATSPTRFGRVGLPPSPLPLSLPPSMPMQLLSLRHRHPAWVGPAAVSSPTTVITASSSTATSTVPTQARIADRASTPAGSKALVERAEMPGRDELGLDR